MIICTNTAPTQLNTAPTQLNTAPKKPDTAQYCPIINKQRTNIRWQYYSRHSHGPRSDNKPKSYTASGRTAPSRALHPPKAWTPSVWLERAESRRRTFEGCRRRHAGACLYMHRAYCDAEHVSRPCILSPSPSTLSSMLASRAHTRGGAGICSAGIRMYLYLYQRDPK